MARDRISTSSTSACKYKSGETITQRLMRRQKQVREQRQKLGKCQCEKETKKKKKKKHSVTVEGGLTEKSICCGREYGSRGMSGGKRSGRGTRATHMQKRGGHCATER